MAKETAPWRRRENHRKGRLEALVVEDLNGYYAVLEKSLPVGHEPRYGKLLDPSGNSTKPTHRWFHFKEAFAHDLFRTLLAEIKRPTSRRITVLDPFAGCGTTLVAAMTDSSSRTSRALGVECNPFLQFVANTKCAANKAHRDEFLAVSRTAARLVRSGRAAPRVVPGLSTFSNLRFFEPAALRDLLALMAAIDKVSKPGVPRDLARLCLAASVEPASGLRRDGRALRYEPRKERADPLQEFSRRVSFVAEDLVSKSPDFTATVSLGDGRIPGNSVPAGTRAQLALFSPPYPNNIDYTEVYKLEAWFLGFIASQSEFRAQRLKTVRSHPSVYFPELYGPSANGYSRVVDALLQPLVHSVARDDNHKWRMRLIRGYFDDMLATLVNLRQVMAAQSKVIFVVGNSLHGAGANQFLIATDLLTARLAEFAGYRVDRIAIARRPSRRPTTPRLRESIIFLTTP